MKFVLGAILLLATGFVLWSASSGEEVPDTPGKEDLPIPDNPQKAIDNLGNSADKAPEWFWGQVVAPLVVVGIIAYICRKTPKLFFMIVGALICLFVVFAIKKN